MNWIDGPTHPPQHYTIFETVDIILSFLATTHTETHIHYSARVASQIRKTYTQISIFTKSVNGDHFSLSLLLASLDWLLLHIDTLESVVFRMNDWKCTKKETSLNMVVITSNEPVQI